MSYEDVAKEAGLNGFTANRFVRFMRTRWADTEAQKCSDGYALEWGIRFKQGLEYEKSDVVGKNVLDRMGDDHGE